MTTSGQASLSSTSRGGHSRPRFRPPRFGLGGAPVGELADPDGDAVAVATVDAAYGAGIRFFDTAPSYGSGRSERRLGQALAKHPRGDYLLSTKVGRLVGPGGPRSDFSAAGIRRSLAESLERLALDAVDLIFVDEPGEHWRQALDESYPTLHELRDQGVIRAIGVAMGQRQLLARFVRETEIDTVRMAGGYTLLDQSGESFLGECRARDVAAIMSGVLTPQVLQAGRTDRPAGPDGILARRIGAVCEQYGVSLPQAALAFPSRHPAVVSVLVGAASAAEIRADAALVRQPVPLELWQALEHQGFTPPTTR